MYTWPPGTAKAFTSFEFTMVNVQVRSRTLVAATISCPKALM